MEGCRHYGSTNREPRCPARALLVMHQDAIQLCCTKHEAVRHSMYMCTKGWVRDWGREKKTGIERQTGRTKHTHAYTHRAAHRLRQRRRNNCCLMFNKGERARVATERQDTALPAENRDSSHFRAMRLCYIRIENGARSWVLRAAVSSKALKTHYC